MDYAWLRKIRKLVIISMFADDYLMDKFVLKGGSAIDLAYKIDARASVDVDLSLESDFSVEEIDIVKKKIFESLSAIFAEEGFVVFDFKFTNRPSKPRKDRPPFWGGYAVEFKILPEREKHLLSKNLGKARVISEIIGPENVKKFIVEISKYEYCELKEERDMEGYTIYVYTPKLLVMEKLRAICQQMKEYKYNGGKARPPRPKDLYDIYVLITKLQVTISKDDLELLERVFTMKEVPVELLKLLPKYRDNYADFSSVQDTVLNAANLLSPSDYFEFVLGLINEMFQDTHAQKGLG